MQSITLGKSTINTSRLTYGCMRISGDGSDAALENGKKSILAAYEAGYTHFDHADIYGNGKCEEIMGMVFQDNPEMRENVTVTTKCGVRFENTPHHGAPARYDLSEKYIMESVEKSLERLNVSAIDIFLLHRPDYLFDPREIASAFNRLKSEGVVKEFGVSNFSVSQMSLVQKFVEMPLIMNQVEFNIHNISAMETGVFDYCLENQITAQAWCPLGGVVYPAWANTFSHEDEKRISEEFQRQSEKYGVEPWLVKLAWVFKHPAEISPLIGSTNPERIKRAVDALAIEYSREDWYKLLEARNGFVCP